MSPEKGRGDDYDAKDDVWALGCMVVGCALGTPMESMGFNTQGILALNRSLVDDLIAKAKAANATLGSLASRMLEQEPRNRLSAQQVVDALSSCRAADDTLGETSSQQPTRTELGPSSDEYARVRDYFASRLERSSQDGLCIQSIEKLVLPQLHQRYDLLLRQMKSRERERRSERKTAVEDGNIELAWAFHACAAEAVENIISPGGGFNRSFAGKNATKYGPGCYFARDSSYSARTTYSRPDQQGVKRMFMCRVALGAHEGAIRYDDKEPPVRDNDHQSGVGQLKYDSTTNNDFKDGVPGCGYVQGRCRCPESVAFMDLSQVSIDELKRRLTERRIDHASCIDKSDLVELLRRSMTLEASRRVRAQVPPVDVSDSSRAVARARVVARARGEAVERSRKETAAARAPRAA